MYVQHYLKITLSLASEKDTWESEEIGKVQVDKISSAEKPLFVKFKTSSERWHVFYTTIIST